MSIVFIIQNAHRLNRYTNQLEPKFDLSSAQKYGEFVYLLSPNARPFSPDHVIGVLSEKLADFSDDDYLLLIGNPCLIGFAVAIAAQVNRGKVKVLQWDGVRAEYIPVVADLRFVGSAQGEKEWTDTWKDAK